MGTPVGHSLGLGGAWPLGALRTWVNSCTRAERALGYLGHRYGAQATKVHFGPQRSILVQGRWSTI